MNKENIKQIHENIINIYKEKAPEKINFIKNKQYTDPIFNPSSYHDEEAPNLNYINLEDIEVLHDLLLIGNQIKSSAIDHNQMINKSRVDLLLIEKRINQALEYNKDILVYNTDNIITIEEEDCYGNFYCQDKSFTLPVSEENENVIHIKNIIGNGYEGNKYVINNNESEDSIVNTSNRSNIVNKNYYLPYEYSRINVYSDEELINNDFNYGKTEAKCIMDLEFAHPSTMLLLTIYGEPIKIKQIECSNDGINYTTLPHKEMIVRIDDTIHYPSSKFLRLHIESTQHTNEIIGAFEHTKDNTTIIKPNVHNKDSIQIQPNGKRHRISIANIQTNKVIYLPSGHFQTRELIEENEEVEAIAFDAEIINNQLNAEIKFHFVVNGKITEVSPISNSDNKIKIIKNNLKDNDDTKSLFIGEPIKSASLLVELKGGGKTQAPVIKNLKILKY